MQRLNRQLKRMADNEPIGNGVRCRSLVLGLGATGLSLVRFLSARGDEVVVADTRDEPPGLDALSRQYPDCEPRLGAYTASLLDGVNRVLVSPGVALSEPLLAEARERGIEIGGDIGLFADEARALGVPVIAITGSNGKSTVTTMLADMLQKAGSNAPAGGNLGTAALDLIADCQKAGKPDYFLLELSSFQLDLSRDLGLRVAALLNISPDHIDRHGDLTSYADSKATIFDGCDVAVANRDDPMVMERVVGRLPAGVAVRSFGLGEASDDAFGLLGAGLDDRHCQLAKGQTALMPIGNLGVTGRHNLSNALAALAMADAIGVPLDDCLEALAKYRGLPHRTQQIADADGLRWIDDSKATNVGATMAAVSGLQGPLVLIAGGQAKGQDLQPLASALNGKVRCVVLLGEDSALLETVLGPVCPAYRVDSMKDAVEMAASKARRGDTVLLSPACGSQDMFDDYRDRGTQFAREVRRLTR